MSEHLDLDGLADVLAGEPSDEVGVHLADCTSCQAALRDLQAALVPVQAALAGLEEPTLPDGLASRLAAITAAERPATPTDEPAPDRTATAATVTPMVARPARRTRWLAAASGVAAAAVLVVGAVVLFPGGSGSKDGSTAQQDAAGIATSSTGTDYLKDGAALKQGLPGLLAGAKASRATGPEAPGDAGAELGGQGLAPLRQPEVLASCLASLSDVNEPGVPLALDYASFEGEPALVVVLPTTKGDKVDVFVVGAGCSQADAKVLFFTRLPVPS